MIALNLARENSPAVFELRGHWGGLLVYRLGAAVADTSFAWGDIGFTAPSPNAAAIDAQPSIPNPTYEQLHP